MAQKKKAKKKTTSTQKKRTKKLLKKKKLAQSKAKARKKSLTSKKATRSKALEPEIVDLDTPSNTPRPTPPSNFSPTKKHKRSPSASNVPVPLPSSSKSLAATDPVAKYLQEIRKYRVLSREEEIDVAKRYKETGDPEAAELLVTSNLRFVVKVAAEYSKFGAKLIDLIQEGNVGLMHAVKEFNPYKGVRLITYAVWWIRGYIQEYLMRQYSLVRIGTTQAQRKLFYQLQKEHRKLASMGFEPNVAQISGRLGIPEKEVSAMQVRLSGRDISLDQPFDDESKSLLDFQEDTSLESIDDQLGHMEELARLKEKLEQIKDSLNEKEEYILMERLLADDPLTLQEIGNKYGITREAVRQLETRLIGKIRNLYD